MSLWVVLGNLSHFAENPEGNFGDECEELSASRDSAPEEAVGEDTPGVSPWELHLMFKS